MKNLTRVLTEILKSESLGLSLDLACFGDTSEEELEKIFKFCTPHDVQNIFASGLINNGLVKEDSALRKKLKNELLISLSRYERSAYEFSAICNAFEQNEIPFLPLKGVILRDYYDKPNLRTSSDIDIFINEKDVKRAVAVLREEHGYTLKENGIDEVSLFSPSGVHLELLCAIKNRDAKENEMIKDFSSNFSVKNGKKYQYEMSLEYFYAYCIAHTARHFKNKGTGIRSILDVYVMNNKFALDAKKLSLLLEKYDLTEFESHLRKLCAVWFDGDKIEETTSLLEKYILFSGAYGTTENFYINSSNEVGKGKYIRKRLWLSKEKLSEIFPKAKINKANVLFYQIRRWFKLLKPKHFRRGLNEVKQAEKVSKNTLEERETLMKALGLK